ncbi:MAG TPA: branched-chain amino acid ABC transporter permease [Polyangiaceae bacterium]|jgi:branched-chain amino acid transport system permease protein|nr:branched-chain amino acid ABC transporter permease [Polyangiaceae bacterium]
METFLHQLLGGIASGVVYASLALALVMIHRVTRLVNFAQGEMALCSTYFAAALIDAGLPYWLAFVATLVASFGMGVLIERVILRPASKAPTLSVVIVLIGLMLALNSVVGWIFGYTTRSFPSPFPSEPPFGNQYVSSHELGMVAVTLLVLGLVYVFFRFTSTGLALRAVADNPASSRLLGIRVERMLALGWGLAAVLGAVAGILVAPILFLDPSMMSGVMLYAFAAALVGGIDSPAGAVVGGIVVGVLENLAGAYVVGTDLKLTTALGLIVVTLVVRPAGLFGRAAAVRV